MRTLQEGKPLNKSMITYTHTNQITPPHAKKMASEMTREQARVISLAMEGKSCILYGAGSTGKSYVMWKIQNYFKHCGGDKTVELVTPRVVFHSVNQEADVYLLSNYMTVPPLPRWMTRKQVILQLDSRRVLNKSRKCSWETVELITIPKCLITPLQPPLTLPPSFHSSSSQSTTSTRPLPLRQLNCNTLVPFLLPQTEVEPQLTTEERLED
jgi:hypothetical protein